MAFLDLSAAFGTVDKSVLINYLSRKFHIHGTVLEWFGSYLTGRTEYVLFKGVRNIRENVHPFCRKFDETGELLVL